VNISNTNGVSNLIRGFLSHYLWKLWSALIILFLMVAGIIFESRAVSPSGHFRQPLLQLQRQGKCEELPQFGVNTHRGRNPDAVNVRLVAEIRARTVRFDIPWIELETEGQYNFGPYDDLINRLRQSGKSIVLLLAYGHPDHSDGRAANGYPLPPRTSEQRAAYARYAAAVAQRYHGTDIVYEIWNEPNLTLFWPPTPDATAYEKLLAESAQAIRSIDPAATIISAGLANVNDPAEFLRAMTKVGTPGGISGISFHPYRQDGPENSLYDIAEFEKAAIGRFDLPLWITEWGYSETWLAKGDFGDVGSRAAVMTARLMLTAALAKSKAALLYDLIDDGNDPGDQESHFGLYDYEFRPKKAAKVFRTLANLMSDCSKYEFKYDFRQDLITAAFYLDDRISYVIWTYAPGSNSDEVCFGAIGAQPIELKDIEGNSLPLEPCSAASQVKVRLKISEKSGPVILQAENTLSK
jgi:hypothetical protein